MLYNLDWLQEGKTFPPTSELPRLKMYRDNRSLFHGEIEKVLEPYQQRIQNIVSKFAEVEGFNAKSFDSFGLDLNYFQEVTLKTNDLIVGEPPTITLSTDTSKRRTNEKLAEIFERVDFDSKLSDTVVDLSRFSESIIRVFLDEEMKKYNYVVNAPDIWFPIVSYENNKNIKTHVLAWVECLNPDADKLKRNFILRAQVHEKGFYTDLTFSLKDAAMSDYVTSNGLNIQIETYKIDKLLDTKKNLRTGLDDFAVIPCFNIRTSDSCHGINDYDKICSIIAELQVRYALESIILDKHSCPTLSVPSSALTRNAKGEWGFKVGGIVEVGAGEQSPSYLVWDASLAANRAHIESLEKHLYSLSEMGAVINDDAFGASQGFEALETRLTNARLKARRISNRLTNPIKKLICMLASKEGLKIKPADITIYWNDGLPNNEFREVEIAERKLRLMDLETILMDHFDKSSEEAAVIAEKMRVATSNIFSEYNEEEEDDGVNAKEAGNEE